MNIARSAKSYVESYATSAKEEQIAMYKYEVEIHRKFTLSIACFILFSSSPSSFSEINLPRTSTIAGKAFES